MNPDSPQSDKWRSRLDRWLDRADREPLHGLTLLAVEVALPFASVAAGLLHVGSPLVGGLFPGYGRELAGLATLLEDENEIARIKQVIE